MFEVRIKPTTIEKRAERLRSKNPTNVVKKPQVSETTPDIIKNRKPQGGGARPNAGRKPKATPASTDFDSMDAPHPKPKHAFWIEPQRGGRH